MAANDGIRLYLDGKLVLDHWQNQDRLSAAWRRSLDLVAGRAYELKLEYFDAERDAGVRLALGAAGRRCRHWKKQWVSPNRPMSWCSSVA